jgi:plasmid stabilization system protein ParE
LHATLIGSPREQFGKGMRLIFHTPYAIYYLPVDHELIVIRVLHSARDAPRSHNWTSIAEMLDMDC